MGVEVIFLERRATLPESIFSYLTYEKRSEEIGQGLLEVAVAHANNCELATPSERISEIESNPHLYHEDIRAAAKKYLSMLFENEIYDVTADALIEKTGSFSELDELAKRVSRQFVEDGKRILLESVNRLQNAYQTAERSITGSGVSVYTSSVSTLLASSLAESGILMSQAKKADRAFQEASTRIGKESDDAIERSAARYLYRDFFPNLSALYLSTNQKLFSTFLEEMSLRDKFDFESIKRFNLKNSCEMLKNLDEVPDKKKLLRMAFDACPFNSEVYVRCFDAGLMDPNSFECAKLFGFDALFTDRTVDLCRASLDEPEKLERALRLASHIERRSGESILADACAKDSDVAKRVVDEMLDALTDDSKLCLWVKMVITDNSDKLCSMDASAVQAKVDEVIDGAVGRQRFALFQRAGLLEHIGLTERNGKTYDSCTAPMKSRMSTAVLSLAKRIFPHQQKCLAECAEMDCVIRERSKSLKSSLDAIEQEVVSLKNERLSLPIFKNGLKKQIDDRLDSLDKTRARIIDEANVEALKRIRERKLQEAYEIKEDYLDIAYEDGDPLDLPHSFSRREGNQLYTSPNSLESEHDSGGKESRSEKKGIPFPVLIGAVALLAVCATVLVVATNGPAGAFSEQAGESGDTVGDSGNTTEDADDFLAEVNPYLTYLGDQITNRSLDVTAYLYDRSDSLEFDGIVGSVSHMTTEPSYYDGDDLVETIGICQWKSNDTVDHGDYQSHLRLLQASMHEEGTEQTNVQTDLGTIDLIYWNDEKNERQIAYFIFEDHLYIRWALSDQMENDNGESIPAEGTVESDSSNNSSSSGDSGMSVSGSWKPSSRSSSGDDYSVYSDTESGMTGVLNDDGEGIVYGDDFAGYFNEDGMGVATDGKGNWAADTDGDGEVDSISIDGGNTWF